PYACDQCGVRYAHKHGLGQHYKEKHLQLKVSCPICNASFTRKTSLKRHILAHSKTNFMECTYCGKLISKTNLQRHIKAKHLGVRFPFSCPLCGVKYQHKRSLRLHMKSTHLQIRFNCPLCGTTFTRKSTLSRHLKSIHSDIHIENSATKLEIGKE
ncbi:hypothetical protein LOTGIDRAFT_127000, partial [Lottia gigantea]